MKYIFRTRNIRFAALTLLLHASAALLFAQDTILVTGVVYNLEKAPVANVSVSVVGSMEMPALTNENGEFTIKATNENAWVIIAPTGTYKTKRVYLNKRREIEITVTPNDMIAGDDWVPILDQNMRRRNILAAHTDVEMESMKHTSAMSVDQHLQGKVPGLQVINRSGSPGSGSFMALRGVNSIYTSNQPLIVVDGIPMVSPGLFDSNLAGYEYNALMSINPFDISKTIVVKDPTITAAYGSKAANGVIFIETLDPSVTQTNIDIDYRNGFSLQPARQIPVLSASQHRTLMSEVLFSSSYIEEEILERYPSLFLEEDDEGFINYTHNTNWQDRIFDNSLYTNFNMNVKGGDGIARYGLSFGYTDANGIIKNTSYQGYNLRFVSLLNIFTWLKMDAGVSLKNTSASLKEAATVKETSPILTSLSKSPLINPFQYDLEENELTTLTEVDELGVSNPLGTIENFEANNRNYDFTAMLGFTGTINDEMKVKSSFSYNYNILKEYIYMPNIGMELYYNDEAINVAKLTNNSLTSFFNNTYLSYNKTIGNDHVISSNTGINLQANAFEYDWGLTKNAHENDEYRMIQDGQNNLREIGGTNRNWNWLSFYEYVNYVYKDKYLASASLSLDGSSRVGDEAANTLKLGGVPFGFFYAGGVAWRISNEPFMSNLSMIEDLKIRASFGRSGNDDIGEASATNYYNSVKFRETVGLYPATVPNPELTYETVTRLNAGVDFATSGNRFAAKLDYFRSETDNMLILSPIDAYFGYDLRIENGGTMLNSGIELSASYRIIDKSAFKWDVHAALSSLNNKVTSIVGEMQIYSLPGSERVNMVGEEANSFYGYIFDGVYSTQAEALEAGLVNERDMPYQAGDAIFRDISGPNGSPDSVINFYDKTVIGSSIPEYFGSISTRLSYKRVSLDIAFQFVYGNDIFNYVRFQNERMSSLDNQSTSVLNRWQYEGHITDVPRALYEDPMGNSDFSSRWIEDGSYARLKHLCLSYSIPEEFLFFNSAEFYISVNNLFTFSRYLGYDPEFAYSTSPIHTGIDYGQVPQPRQFIAGIKLGL